MKYVNKSFSVGMPGVDQAKWDKIFKKNDKSKPGVLRKCDCCDSLKYCWEVNEDWMCGACIDLENGFSRPPLND